MKTLEERKIILDEEALRLIGKGWIVKSRSDTTCLLIKEDTVAGCLSLIVSLLVLFPFFDKHIKTHMIEVTLEGKIKTFLARILNSQSLACHDFARA